MTIQPIKYLTTTCQTADAVMQADVLMAVILNPKRNKFYV
jgi:hypothetical protein